MKNNSNLMFMNFEIKIKKNNKGYTLIELMIALGLIGIVLALSSSYFLSANSQFLNRMKGSDNYKQQVLLQIEMDKALRREIQDCNFGNLKFTDDSPNFLSNLKGKYPQIKELKFYCYELNLDKEKLQTWKLLPQPELVEYNVSWNYNGKDIQLVGSVLK